MRNARRTAVIAAMTIGSIVVAASAGAMEEPPVEPVPVWSSETEASTPDPMEKPPSGSEESPAAQSPGEGEDQDSEHGNQSVLVCVATGDRESPYTPSMAVTTHIIDGHGQVKSGGPADSVTGVFPADVWGNIVPAVSHPSGASFAGLNMGPDGQEIWADGCGTGSDPEPPPPHEHEGVIVCEASTDVASPYARVSVPATHIIKGNGQIVVSGPADTVIGVFPDEPWGSIVPPFTHPNGREFAGVNWTELGETIWGSDCIYVASPPEPPAPAPAPAPVPAPVLLASVDDAVEPVPEEPEPVVSVNPVEPATVLPDAPTGALTDDPGPSRPVTVALPTAATLPTSVPAGGGAMANR